MKKYIVANWKMNPQTWGEAEAILDFISEEFQPKSKSELSLVICPPFVFLEDVARIVQESNLKRFSEIGAQDVALADSGAWTGEVSAPMLRRLGVRYVIIGHSERRWKIGETDEVINKKLITALENELVPIVCVGEKERKGDYQDFLKNQIEETFKGISADQIKKCFIAYEPVWAISTNPNAKPDKPENTVEAVALIKEILGPETRVLYGGSVTKNNSKEFLALPEISGVLVGGASVRKEEFIDILKGG